MKTITFSLRFAGKSDQAKKNRYFFKYRFGGGRWIRNRVSKSTVPFLIITNTLCSESVAAELNLPLRKLDAVLSRIDAEIGMENRRLELRLERLAKTRQLLDAPEGMRKGLAAALLMAEGYTSREAGMKLHMSSNSVRALASRARRYLRESPEFSQLTGGCL